MPSAGTCFSVRGFVRAADLQGGRRAEMPAINGSRGRAFANPEGQPYAQPDVLTPDNDGQVAANVENANQPVYRPSRNGEGLAVVGPREVHTMPSAALARQPELPLREPYRTLRGWAVRHQMHCDSLRRCLVEVRAASSGRRKGGRSGSPTA